MFCKLVVVGVTLSSVEFGIAATRDCGPDVTSFRLVVLPASVTMAIAICGKDCLKTNLRFCYLSFIPSYLEAFKDFGKSRLT
jgi:hypothetical protein